MPEYINKTELAKRLCTSTTTIRNWEHASFDDFVGPFPQSKKEVKEAMYNWDACLLWSHKYYAYSALDKNILSKNGNEDYAKLKEEGDARKALANASLAELELAKEQNKVASVSVMEEKIAEVALVIKQKLLTLSPRLEILLSLNDEDKNKIDSEIRDVLKELSEMTYGKTE